MERYTSCFNAFVLYLQQLGRSWPTTFGEYDLIVSEYLEVLWDSGEPKSLATYSLAGLQYFIPALKKNLPRSWKLKATWDKLELPCQAIPLDVDTLFAFVGYFWKTKQRVMALASIIGFNGLLRTGELLNLRKADCHRTDSGYLLVLQVTKGGQRRLIQDESVSITDALTIWCLDVLLEDKLPGDWLVGLSGPMFRTRWNNLKKNLGLQSHRFLPYSLRRGGATWFFNHTGSFSQTMLRGRWQHLKTCKLYISEAQTSLTALALPQSTRNHLHTLADQMRPLLSRWASRVRVEGQPH